MISFHAMPILIGIICLALGISLAVAWLDAFVIALKGVFVLSLLFWGAIAVLVGYSEMKAAREFDKAISEPPAPAASGSANSAAPSAPPTASAEASSAAEKL